MGADRLGRAGLDLGEIYYTAVLWDDPDPPIPSPADAGYLLFPPLALLGALALLRARARDVPARLWIDGVTAALGVARGQRRDRVRTVLDGVDGAPVAIATALAYPLVDLVLLALIVGALAGTGWRLDRTWMLLAVGVSTFWLADSLYLVRTAEGTYESGGWFDVGWWAGLTLIAAAAWQPQPAGDRRPAEERLRADRSCRSASGWSASGCSCYGAVAGINPLAVALAAAALLAVMARLR